MPTMNVIRIALDGRIVDRLKKPINAVWQLIGYDVVSECQRAGEPIDNETAIECCVDADRLRFEGNDRQADDFFNMIVTEHGYPAVLAFLSKNIRLI